MSTGLTWVTITDTSVSTPDTGVAVIQFSDYAEAREYGNWLLRLYNANISYSGQIYIAVYTRSPNESGFYFVSGGEVNWAVFD